MIIKEITEWKFGTINAIEDSSIPKGALSDSINFLTKGDRIELRRGSKILGTGNGAGAVSGIGVGTKLDSAATQILFLKRKGSQKLEYYDDTTEDFLETGSNAVPTAAVNDDFEFDTYGSPAGAQAYWSSPLSSIYKILIANPGSVTDLLSTVYRGFIRIKQSRMFLWNKSSASGSKRRDEQNPYMSYIDTQTYTTVTAEALADVATGTLAFKAAGAKRTCFGVIVTHTASGEVYSDNRDGTLTGDLGGTGTVNYTTGVITTNRTGAGTADYQWEDSTSTGIADFSFSGTRTAGQGNVFIQGDGGPLMGIESYADTEYCAHKNKFYALTLTRDDTGATNLVFRDREGIPNHRAIKGTSLGIFYVNAVDVGDPKIKLVSLQQFSTAVDGVIISQNLNLSTYLFDKCFIHEWEDYIIIGCRTEDSSDNNRFVMFNKIWKAFDIVDYWGLCAVVLNGALVVGESISKNAVTMFSGIDDDGAVVDGYAAVNNWDLEYPGILKKCKKLEIEGDIGPDQVFDVQASIDGGAYVTIGQIDGNGTYVDRGQRTNVGADTIGRHPVGGNTGATTNIVAYHYFRSISLRLDKFERIKIKFVRGIRTNADDTQQDGIGYFAVSTLRFRDIRIKNSKIARKYRN